MDFNGHSRRPDNSKVVVAITPSLNRQEYLIQQMDAFWKPYQELRKADPVLPDLKWIIVDESPKACTYFQNNSENGLTYIHLPSRNDLSTVPGPFRNACADCLHTEKGLQAHIGNLAATLSDRFAVVHNPAIPSIGEMRNIGIRIAESLYLEKDPHAVVFAKDDDDFSAAAALPALYDLLQEYDFAKFGNMLVYDSTSRDWYFYSMKHQDDTTYIIENKEKSTLPRYVVWDDAAQTRENPYKHLGIYGCTFSYRLETAARIGNERRQDNGRFGPFEPLSRREDVAFSDLMVRECGLDRIAVMDNDNSWMVRIVHNNATRTMHHGIVDVSEIDPEVAHFVSILCRQQPSRVPEKRPAASRQTGLSLIPVPLV